jgi:hypothetical protein
MSDVQVSPESMLGAVQAIAKSTSLPNTLSMPINAHRDAADCAPTPVAASLKRFAEPAAR